MKIYELVVLMKANDNFYIKKFISIIKNIININNCNILTIEHWGFRKLSYSINKNFFGYYIFFSFNLDLSTLSLINFYLKFNINILRFFVIMLKIKTNKVSFFVLKRVKFKIDKKRNIKKNYIKNKYYFKLNK